MSALEYAETIDQQQEASQCSRTLAIGRNEFGTSPTWTRGYRLFYGTGRFRWHWYICDGWHGPTIASGYAWTLGGVYRAMLAAQVRA